MPLVCSGISEICVWLALERPSRTNRRPLTARATMNTGGITVDPGMSHSVRARAISRRVVKNRKTLSKAEGRNDFECSRGDNSPMARAAARSNAAATIVARVRNAAYRGSVHSTSRANLRRQSTTMVI